MTGQERTGLTSQGDVVEGPLAGAGIEALYELRHMRRQIRIARERERSTYVNHHRGNTKSDMKDVRIHRIGQGHPVHHLHWCSVAASMAPSELQAA